MDLFGKKAEMYYQALLKVMHENQDLVDKLNKYEAVNELEYKWNNKRPNDPTYTYAARNLANLQTKINVDPRIFFNYTEQMPIIVGNSNDQKVSNALAYVIDKIKYTKDDIQFKTSEQWLFWYETFKLGKGDCEDGAIFLANLLLRNGIPYWRVRLNAGNVQGGGHCWVTYLRESDNQWIILDWCYWPSESGKLYKDAEKYFTIWFSFNTRYIFVDEKYERETTNYFTNLKKSLGIDTNIFSKEIIHRKKKKKVKKGSSISYMEEQE